ncbi:YdeI family protein [Nonomuraea sp. NPDC050783]|uniref:YdeI/OmpD-associated family protein n=1 Tax=Nonomuraea sp. NPDC050783 TaxID=3154634 RepID=UPI003467C6DA
MEIFEDAAAWRAWLERHGGSASEVWVVLAKKGTPGLTYVEAVEEALCHGWIDGLTRSRDAGTYLQRYTPRRPRSGWSRSNVERVARLTREGRMRPAGLAAVERARADGRWPG